MPTVSERVVEALTQDRDLDDDELAIRLDVHPRQSINQVCRRLEREGKLVRIKEPGRKIVNRLASGV